ncbi:trypsin-like peptidase domain-containing protein [Streptomyces sp. NRRL F-5650]|uniref:trypsin-like peptidase domain-containing protein n=1 Tax=Streptomyces sp. NRRL F-5650 TaxID=1463868 RepID=UPI0004C9E4EC|nr:trypsin-like peptidase domain-containing protein [Streptomyces sp. NRRL F-5650]
MASRNRSRGATGGTVDERPGSRSGQARGEPTVLGADPVGHASDAALIRFHDLAGRPRGTGFVADHHGTVLTSHEAVDGLSRLVLSTAGDRRRVVAAADVTPLPDLGLALVRAGGLGVDPLPLTTRARVEAGTYVRIAAGGWREARVLGTTDVTYAATDRFHLLGDALELAVGTSGRDALRLGGGAAGGPVLDVTTGAVLGVLGTALSSGHSDVGFAVPLHRAATGPLAGLLAENAATVPAYGADLNLAGVLALTATSVTEGNPAAGPGGASGAVEPVERAATVREFAAFAASPARVLGLVGAPGSGRTTELAALAARRSAGVGAAPTLWLRGADLHDDDMSLADAARRTLARAARIVAASDPARPDGLGDVAPERLAHLARTSGRPLLVLLDGPEEMPSVLAHRLPEWTEGTATWLRETGARLVVACRAEYWEHAGAEFPRELLYGPDAATRGPVRAAAAVGGRAAGAAREGRPPWAAGSVPGSGGPVPGAEWPAGEVSGVRGTLPGAARGVGGAVGDGTGGGASVPGVSGREAHPPRAGGGAGAEPVPGTSAGLPPCVRLRDLRGDEAREARARYGVPDGVLAEPDAGHPLTLRLLAEVRAALPGDPAPVPVTRDEVFAAYLDLMCLRVATRLAGENGLHGTPVRRLAAKVSGQVHEAARRSLGPGQGGLDRDTFEALFPWGPAPARLGGGTGWAPAVLAEGLFVPAGRGYRFAHEELADWIQGTHLDLDEALRALVHRRDTPHGTRTLPVPHHRIGSVVEALLLLARQHGVPQLSLTLEELVHALDLDPHSWWAARLLADVLTRLPDATPYTEVLRLLADTLAERRGEAPQVFGPGFWTAVRVPETIRLDLLRRLVLADGPPHEPGPRHLDTVAGLLTADPAAVQPLLVRWFDDERPLPATPHATVATAAQALLHTHRHRGLDGLTEVLVDSAHRRADELLAVLAEEEPSALCRAVERWARDERPARQAAAVTHGLRTAPHARTAADRTLLRHAALVLLAGPSGSPLRGGALALLVQDPGCRDRHLPRALDHFAACDPHLPPSAVATALPTHPEPVLEAFRARLLGPDAGEALRSLADATTPALAHPVADLVGRAVRERPETAGHLAAYVDRRLDRDPAPHAVLLPLVTRLLDAGPEPARAALAAVLATDGSTAGAPQRRALREHLFAHEHEPAVLDALLHAAARCAGDELRALVHRTGLLLVRTSDGATRFDRGLVDLARHLPGFATRLTGWLADAPEDWAALVGPSTRRTIEQLAGVRVPA